jgi:hypothetical protein
LDAARLQFAGDDSIIPMRYIDTDGVINPFAGHNKSFPFSVFISFRSCPTNAAIVFSSDFRVNRHKWKALDGWIETGADQFLFHQIAYSVPTK